MAEDPDLTGAAVRCVGEQLHGYLAARLGMAPEGMQWDAVAMRSWLPLDRWMRQFHEDSSSSQVLDERNWLSRQTHLRRLLVEGVTGRITAGQRGRVCPFETPEGPNVGRVLSVARGAAIRNQRIVVTDDAPEAALGLSAALVPFLEHDDPNRLLMGVNMMRQWLPLPDPEPALVVTGNEPHAPRFWCGRNLLTAFISAGIETYEDGILLSESAARRLGHPEPARVGDKLSNRHGTKGTVSRILPDGRMPRLADGSPVDLAFSFVGCHTRGNFGQLREALMGRLAREEGGPAVAPPFRAPDDEQLRRRLREAGLPESGMEKLTWEGEQLRRPSTVGWVYWGVTHHLAADKLRATVTPGRCMLQGDMEYYALRNVAAFETIAEHCNTRAERREGADRLAERVAEGPVEQASPPTPAWDELRRRLAVAGVRMQMADGKVTFEFAPPEPAGLELARPIPHPWLHSRQLRAVGQSPGAPEYEALREANRRARRVLDTGAPRALVDRAMARLKTDVAEFLDCLVTPAQLQMRERQLFSGKALLSPGWGLSVEQVGLAEEIAWTLFGPFVQRQLGSRQAVEDRTVEAEAALDGAMADSWVILNRAPTMGPTSLLAFHPVRCPEDVIRLHPLTCRLLHADFDGDQAAVILPVTEAGQAEAGELLSVAAHLRRDPELLEQLVPEHGALWGLLCLSLSEQGRTEIAELAGAGLDPGCVTREALHRAMQHVMEQEGVEGVLKALERLEERGLEAARRSGASIGPFFGSALEFIPPADDTPEAWSRCAQELGEQAVSRVGVGNDETGPAVLLVKSGARGSIEHLVRLAGPFGAVEDETGQQVPMRHGLREGLLPEELFACAATARRGLVELVTRLHDEGRQLRTANRPRGFHVLARAMRAERPGVVFASAAASGETDPLTDLDSRLFVGVPVA